MCGIAGLSMSAVAPDAAVVAALGRALAHRGPDGGGHSVLGRVALVHTRLAIIDVAGGDQPFHAGPATLIANGEIYNYRELRAEMAGVSFATHSDCEPPLHLWLRDGAGYAAELRGMYAIAIHERAQRSLTLSRDPFGIKPLYVATIPGGLAFASEAQALLATGLVERRVNAVARDELLQMQFTTGRRASSRGSTGCCRGRASGSWMGMCWIGRGWRACRRVGRRTLLGRRARMRRWGGWMRR